MKMSLKKLALGLGLLAVLVTSGSAAVYDFNALTLGTFQAYAPPPLVPVSINHPVVTVNPPFAFSSLVATQVVDFGSGTLPPTIEGHFTFTAPSGETLRGDYEGILLPTPNPLGYSVPATFEFTGGTGLFAGATGGGNLTAAILFTDATLMGGSSSICWRGQVDVVPEPAAAMLGSVGLMLLVVRRWRRS